jgi:DNA processing protein
MKFTEEKYTLAALQSLPNLGKSRIDKLIAHFGNPSEAWQAGPLQWRDAFTLTVKGWNEIGSLFKIELPEQLEIEFYKRSITVLTEKEEAYPRLLREIVQPPMCLFIKGNYHETKPCVAIVGSRAATHYGKSVASYLAEALADCGFIIVSGLAKGIDSVAHRGALKKGCTYAVLGSGHDYIYPPDHAKLAEEIQEKGAVISEYFYALPPNAGYFPARNRIISGLSVATLVVEAKETSGSLITANFALEQGREVFAVPGNIFSENSKGCHDLIRQGAKLVSSIEDILDEFQYLHLGGQTKSKIMCEELQLTIMQQKILSVLEVELRHLDEIALELVLPIGSLLAEMTQLELLGLAKGHPGGYYNKEAL